MKNSEFNYRIDAPMSSEERSSRRIKTEIGRILVESKIISKTVGYLKVSEEIVKKTFNILSDDQGVVVLPLGLHMTYKEFIKAAGVTNNVETFFFRKLDGFSANCSTIELFIDFFRLIKCETVVILPSARKYSYEALFMDLLSAVETNQYDLILTTYLNQYESYGFLSLNHQNLEIIGYTAKIKKIYCDSEDGENL